MKFIPVLLLLCLLLTSTFLQGKRIKSNYDETNVIIATTYNLKDNDTLAKVSTNNFNILQNNSQLGSYVIESYTNILINTQQNQILLYGVQGDSSVIDIYDLKTLNFKTEMILPGDNAPEDIQLFSNNKIISVVASGDYFSISMFDLSNNGNKTVFNIMKEVTTIIGSSFAYNNKENIYFVPVIVNNNNTYPSQYYVYKIKENAAGLIGKIPIKNNFIENAEYDVKRNRIVGVIDEVFTILDLKTNQFISYGKTLNFNSIGFRELGASCIDDNYYYVLYNNHKAETHFIKVDLENLTYKVVRWYDHIGAMAVVN
ncbi:hypothetical protein ABK040_011655 [Willaertia magna]